MVEETTHAVIIDDARSLDAIQPDSVELVVTSPPYPMIEMWDDVFTSLDPSIGTHLSNGNGQDAFNAMHAQLDRVWEEVRHVVTDGGIVCVNIGDATRTLDGSFQQYPNHARILTAFRDLGFHVLPSILWQKPTNSGAKFMGSGCLPPNQYPTLEHEHILIFRNGESRAYPERDSTRYESAYFWEERNAWFSDHWTEITGIDQELTPSTTPPDPEQATVKIGGADERENKTRDRSGAFPIPVPYRLINMFTAYGETVLDPFLGTGTTTLAAMMSGRDSIGYEIDEGVAASLSQTAPTVPARSHDILRERIEAHQTFAQQRREAGDDLQYTTRHYPMPVMTTQERDIRFYEAVNVTPSAEGRDTWHFLKDDSGVERFSYNVQYEPFDGEIPTHLSRFTDTTLG